MTVDDDNSVYVGGIPYNCTEYELRRNFELYGSVVAIKIVNDRGVGGKCYGFVTFKNPRSAIEAISEMDGRTIGGRVVRVNEVKTRGSGSRSNHGHESSHHSQREVDWDKGRSRERDIYCDKNREHDHSREHDGERKRRRDHSREHDGERERRRDHSREDDGERERRHDHSREHDGERERRRDHSWEHDGERERRRDHSREHDGGRERRRDHSRERFQGRDRQHSRDVGEWEKERKQVHGRNGNRERERCDDLNAAQEREFDRVYDNERGVNKIRDQHTKIRNSSCEQKNREHSLEASDYQYQVEELLDWLVKKREELQKEKSDMGQRLEEKKQLIADLQRRYLKLEDLLTSAKKQSSVHQLLLTKLCKCFQQVKEYGEKLKSSEEELLDLVNSVSMEVDASGELGAKDA